MAHTSHAEIQKKLEIAKSKVTVGGRYYHWKDTSALYEILSVAIAEWDEEVVVIYKSVSDDITWVRKLEGEDGWLTPVNNGPEDKKRFIPVNK